MYVIHSHKSEANKCKDFRVWPDPLSPTSAFSENIIKLQACTVMILSFRTDRSGQIVAV